LPLAGAEQVWPDVQIDDAHAHVTVAPQPAGRAAQL